MINKTFKRIHNKYSTLFKFIFFLRYLFVIFFIALVLFLSIPHLFDLKKREKVIENYLFENYDLKLKSYDSIKYNTLPIPSLEIHNAYAVIGADLLKIEIKNLSIYPKLLNIYNYKNFEANKIILNKNVISLKDYDFKILYNYIHNLKNQLAFKDLDLRIDNRGTSILNLEKINFSNYGYNKNIVKGELFDKKFKISISDNYNKINFKLLKTGISADINFNEININSILSGVFKSKILNTNIKFSFDYDGKKLKIYKSYFRNKDLSFNNESVITYQPFFHASSTFNIENINKRLFKKINISKIFTSKNFIKKINIKNQIIFKSKGFRKNLIDNLILNTDLTYGRLFYEKKFLIAENPVTCQGNINLLEEYPILYFECLIVSNDKKKLLKEFSINYKIRKELFALNIKGNINILNNKINFKKITINQNYEATKEDLTYFKQTFENILLDKNVSGIFNLKKIKEFILEIS